MEILDVISRVSQEVNYNNAQDAAGYATLIFAAAKENGIIFDKSKRQSYEGVKITQMANAWVGNIKSRIADMTAGDAMEILEPYDFMHRIGQLSPIPRKLYDEYIMKAFEARIHGDKTVNEYYLFRFIRGELDKKSKLYFGRPLEWYSSSLERWHKKLRYGKTTSDLSGYDTLEIVSILMSEDLFMFEGGDQDKFKKKLFDNHRHYLDKIDTLNFIELSALSHFLSNSSKYMPQEQYKEYNKAITSAQIARPDTNRWYRINLQNTLGLIDR